MTPDQVQEWHDLHDLVIGRPPPASEKATDEQLIALNHKLKGTRGPYVDFAVWGPFGDRTAKHMRTVGQIFIGSMLTDRQVHGPPSFEGWLCCWKVFRYAAYCLNIASPGAIKAYSDGMKRLVMEFPKAWPLIYSADDIVRSEQWREVYRTYKLKGET